ncbi:hypothetical protein AAVH_41455, partial [Aphelenchoides avenae]
VPQYSQLSQQAVGFAQQQQHMRGFDFSRVFPCRVCNEVHYHGHGQHMQCNCHPQ